MTRRVVFWSMFSAIVVVWTCWFGVVLKSWNSNEATLLPSRKPDVYDLKLVQTEGLLSNQAYQDTAEITYDRPEKVTVRTAQHYLQMFDKEENDFPFFDSELDEHEANLLVQELRRRYPVVSISERLTDVNNASRIEELRLLYPVKHEVADEEELTTGHELPRRFRSPWQPRAAALEMLHGEKAIEFVKTPQFGLFRMPPITPRSLKYATGELALKTQTNTEALYQHEKIVELPSINSVSLDPAQNGEDLGIAIPTAGLSSSNPMPYQDWMSDFAQITSAQFLNPDSIGFVVSPQKVAGFEGHSITNVHSHALGISINSSQNTNFPAEPSKEKWNLNRLELVSILNHDEFGVYVSESLPNMNDLAKVETRKLDTFEYLALGRLFKGEDVVTQATSNRIRMLGALRAEPSCLECHSVKSGELLGALSYELIRQSSIVEE